MDDILIRLENSYPFDSNFDGYDDEGYPVYDRAVAALMLRLCLKQFFTTGIFGTPETNLMLTKADGYNINIKPGVAIIDGGIGAVADDIGLDVQIIEEPPRGIQTCSVFIRLNDNLDARSLYVRIAHTVGETPAEPITAPAIYELRLGYIVIPSNAEDLSEATIYDERGTSVCPYAAPFMEVDIPSILENVKAQAGAQYDAFIQFLTTNMEFITSALDGTTAGYLQNRITELKAEYDASFEKVNNTLYTDEGLMDLRESMGLGHNLDPIPSLYDTNMIDWLQLRKPWPEYTNSADVNVNYGGWQQASGSFLDEVVMVTMEAVNGSHMFTAKFIDSEGVVTSKSTESISHSLTSYAYNRFSQTKLNKDTTDFKWLFSAVAYVSSGHNSTSFLAYSVDCSDNVISYELLGSQTINNTFETGYTPSYSYLKDDGLYFIFPAQSNSNTSFVYGVHMENGVTSYVRTTTAASYATLSLPAGESDETIIYTKAGVKDSFIELDKDTLEVIVHSYAPPEGLYYEDDFFFFSKDEPAFRTYMTGSEVKKNVDDKRIQTLTKTIYSERGDTSTAETTDFIIYNYAKDQDKVVSNNVFQFDKSAIWLYLDDSWLISQYYLIYTRNGSAMKFLLGTDTVGFSSNTYNLPIELKDRPFFIPLCDIARQDDGSYAIRCLFKKTFLSCFYATMTGVDYDVENL